MIGLYVLKQHQANLPTMPPIGGLPQPVEPTPPTPSLGPSGQLQPVTSDAVTHAIAIGQQLLGRPYVFGSPCGRSGNCTDSFDCSSFIRYIFTQAGVNMPYAQTGQFADHLPRVSESDLRVGDVFVWQPPGGGSYAAGDAHTGVYIGGGHTLECRWPTGVGVYTPLNRPHVIVRPVS